MARRAATGYEREHAAIQERVMRLHRVVWGCVTHLEAATTRVVWARPLTLGPAVLRTAWARDDEEVRENIVVSCMEWM